MEVSAFQILPLEQRLYLRASMLGEGRLVVTIAERNVAPLFTPSMPM